MITKFDILAKETIKPIMKPQLTATAVILMVIKAPYNNNGKLLVMTFQSIYNSLII